MNIIQEIRLPINNELVSFEKQFKEVLKSKVPLLDKILQFVLRRKGKQMRPMFVFLSANLCNGIFPATYRAASLIELLHTATLIHDDVVDDSDERRGFFSLNALWKNKISVLIGDYLLSRGLLLSVEHKDFKLLEIVSNAVKLMSEGELLQIQKSRTLNITESVYFEIIKYKTASLIASCCESGASSSNGSPEDCNKLHQFGEKLGMAFQIKDDLFDYGGFDVGKPIGIDLKEKKLTLPLIHALSNQSWLEKRKILNIVKNHANNKKKVQWLIGFVRENGGIEYAKQTMFNYVDDALKLLHTFPESNSRNSLELLANYTIQRQH